MTAEDAINVFKEQFCGLDAYCEIHRDGLCLTDGCEVWWAIKALEQYKADAVEIIRCKDCKHWDASDIHSTICPDHRRCKGITGKMYTAPDYYCAYGERKDG